MRATFGIFSASSVLEVFANIEVLLAVFTLENLNTSLKVRSVIISVIIIIDKCKSARRC